MHRDLLHQKDNMPKDYNTKKITFLKIKDNIPKDYDTKKITFLKIANNTFTQPNQSKLWNLSIRLNVKTLATLIHDLYEIFPIIMSEWKVKSPIWITSFQVVQCVN